MKRRTAGLLGLVILAAAAPAFAGVTFTTHDGATNSLGNPVSASAEFTIVPDGILVKINNTTPDIKHFSQSLQGLTFTVFGRRAQGEIVYSRAQTRTIQGEDMQTTPEPQDTGWQLTMTGMTYTLRAPSRRNHILPQTDELSYRKGDKTITDAPESNPFLVGPVTIHIKIKDIALTDDIIGVKFSWGDELGGFDGKLTADTSNGGSISAAGGGGGGDGNGFGGSINAGTPGDISLIPSTPGDGDYIVHEGALYGEVGQQPDDGRGIEGGGDPGGGSGTGTSTPTTQPPAAGSNPPTTPQIPFIPTLADYAHGAGPNPTPPTDVASTPATQPSGDTPPDVRITVPQGIDGPNPTPPTDTLTDAPPIASPGDILPASDIGPIAAPISLGAVQPGEVPEPASLALLATGAAAALLRRRRAMR